MLFAHSLRPAPPLLIFMAENMRRRKASHKKRSSSILSATCLASSSLSVELPPLRFGDIFVLGADTSGSVARGLATPAAGLLLAWRWWRGVGTYLSG